MWIRRLLCLCPRGWRVNLTQDSKTDAKRFSSTCPCKISQDDDDGPGYSVGSNRGRIIVVISTLYHTPGVDYLGEMRQSGMV